MLVPTKATAGSDAGKTPITPSKRRTRGTLGRPPPSGEPKSRSSSRPRGSGGRMEIHLNNGITVRVTSPVDDSELKRVLAVAAAVTALTVIGGRCRCMKRDAAIMWQSRRWFGRLQHGH